METPAPVRDVGHVDPLRSVHRVTVRTAAVYAATPGYVCVTNRNHSFPAFIDCHL